jgi:hypothetical protein
MPRYIVERTRRRPMTGACTDQSLHTSGVVGSAHPPEFSTAGARAAEVDGLSLAQLLSGSPPSLTFGGSCSPVSSGGGRSTTRLVIVVNGKQVGTTKAVATGSSHPWQTGVMVVTFQGDPAATVAFTNFAITQLTP